MKSKAVVGYLALFAIVTSAIALTVHFKKQAKLLADYCSDIVSERIKMLTAKRVVIELDFSIKNKSDIDVKVNSYDLIISINSKKVSRLKATVNQELKAKAKSIFTLVVDFVPKDVMKEAVSRDFLAGLLLDKSKVTVSILGYATISHKAIKIENAPINITMTLAEILAPSPSKEKC